MLFTYLQNTQVSISPRKKNHSTGNVAALCLQKGINLLPKLIPIHPKLHPIIIHHACARRIPKAKPQWNIIILRDIQLERRLIECDPCFGNPLLRVSRSPKTIGRVGEMETLAFGEETTFVYRTACFVWVLLAFEIAGQFPRDVGFGVGGESVI